ncbi:MAG: hypothetical protein R2724_28835 [Bryobacterales bacterium]
MAALEMVYSDHFSRRNLHIRWAVVAALLGSSVAGLAAEPFVYYRGAVNAASFAAPGLPNGALARGSIFSIFGANLGPPGGASVRAFPLQTDLGGVRVDVCQGETCVAAYPLYIGATQVNAILPSDAPLGAASLRVTVDGAASNWTPVEVAAASFGAFAVNSGGFGPGIVQNFVSQTDQPLASKLESASPRQVVTLWGTGLGAGLNADDVAPLPGDLPTEVEIWVGGAQVTRKLYSGRSPCCAGVDQIVFEIPANAPTGCGVPVQVIAGGVASNATTIAIATQGGACSPEAGALSPLAEGGRTALLALSKLDFTPAATLASATAHSSILRMRSSARRLAGRGRTTALRACRRRELARSTASAATCCAQVCWLAS